MRPRLSSAVLSLACCLAACGGEPERASGVRSGLALAEAERVYLAQIEQRGLAMSSRGLPALAAAVRRGEAAGVRAFFAPAFRGEPRSPGPVRKLAGEVLEVHRSAATDADAAAVGAVDADAFAAYLVGLRARFGPDARVQLALTSFSPFERARLDGAWRGKSILRMVGPRAGPGEGELLATLEFELTHVPDVDAIAGATGWWRAVRVVDLQEATVTAPLFEEVGPARGLDRSRLQDNWNEPAGQRPISTGGLYVADLDGDGLDDVFVPDARGMFLFRGRPEGRFEDVTAASGLPGHVRGVLHAACGDFDGDGLVDLVVSRRTYRNLGGMRFQDVTATSSLAIGSGVTGYTVVDYDRDGRLDLYVSRNHATKAVPGAISWIDGPGGPGNQLLRNLGGWRFEDVTVKANASAGNRSVFTAAWLDADEDGWPDVYAINEFGGGTLLVNQRDGTFRDRPLVDDLGDFGSMGLAVGDYDNDGHVDVFACNMYSKAGRRIFENLSPGTFPPATFAKIKRFVTGSELYRNEGAGRFSRVGKAMRVHAVGWAYGATFFDLDNDGYLDLYGTAGFVSVNKDEPDG